MNPVRKKSSHRTNSIEDANLLYKRDKISNGVKKAVVLLSGGMDSVTTLWLAKQQGYQCLSLIFDYGQLHRREVEAAKKIAKVAKCEYEIISFCLPWGGSALLDKGITIPQNRRLEQIPHQIPPTYVPARNTIFLSFALSWAEVVGAGAIFIGAHSRDFSGYPDCRPAYFEAWQELARKATKTGIEGGEIKVVTPLVDKTKREIIAVGMELGVPFELTWSCYKGNSFPCGKCDSCLLRARGFEEAGIEDPLLARNKIESSK